MEHPLHATDHIQAELDDLTLQENEILKTLQDCMKQNAYVDGKIRALGKMVVTVDKLKSEAEALVSVIKDVKNSSDAISSKVRQLDRARSRVGECQQRVGDLIDLELCSQGVQAAILKEDYEKGAGHIHRFLSMDQTLLQRTATDVEHVSSVLKAVQTLQDAASQLRNIVQSKFDGAVAVEDLVGIERFFKVFPLLGMHDEGIKRFCSYLCSKLQETAEKNLSSATSTTASSKRYHVIFADTLTLLFEGLARIIDIHQPLIETYYGPGHLLAVVGLMQKECDNQTNRIIIEFNRYRQIGKKTTQINEAGKMSSSASFSKLEKLDPKELDLLIQEIALMHVRTEMYLKFIKQKVQTDIEVSTATTEERKENGIRLEKLISNSDLVRNKHELLSKYLRLEQYFMEESIGKAVNMDVIDSSQHTSSIVDDTFFIVRKCIRRAVSSKSLDGICAIINIACGTLENDFCNVLRGRLRQGYPWGYLDLTQAYNVLQTSIQQGRLQPSDTEQMRTAFTVALNNADTSVEYIETLCDSILQDVENTITNMSSNEHGKLESCLSGLSSVTTNLKEIVEYGIEQLRAGVVKPRVNPWIDSFSGVNHQFSEEELSEYEAGESFVQTLIMNLDGLLLSFKDTLTPTNYDRLVKVLATEVTARLEKNIFKSTFNRLGGLILDKEVRSLASYLTTLTSWSVRDKFARLMQIGTILNLEKASEISDYWGNDEGILTWRLTPAEVKMIMSLRTDFKLEDIHKIKL